MATRVPSVEESTRGKAAKRVEIRLSQEELRDRSHVFALWLTAAIGWVLLLTIAVRVTISSWLVALIVLLCAGSGAGAALRSRRPRLARSVLLLALCVAYFCARLAFANGGIPYAALLVTIACSTMMPVSVTAILTLLLCIGMALFELSVPAAALGWSGVFSVVSMLILGTMLSCVAVYQQDLALEWASVSTSRALQLAAELRERQMLLNRTLRAMDEANERLAIANQRLSEARRLADEAYQAKARFAASVSHELRTPLNLIVGFAETLYKNSRAYQGVVLSSDFLLDLGVIYRNAEHLQKLIDDVLDLAQIDVGQVALEWSEVALAPLLAECIETIAGLAAMQGLELEVHIPQDLPNIHTDRTRVKQVILNLLNNAARYTERGKIVVSVRVEANEVVCSIQDTGPGIAPEDLTRLFGEFERITPRNNPARKGTGLGLAISRRFIQALGGRIWAESTLGAGSTFSFALPLGSGASHLAALPTLPRRHAPAESRDTVLLISRSVLAARLFSRHLQQYHCLAVTGPEHLSEKIALTQPKGIIIDEALGSDAIEQVRDTLEHVSVQNIPLIVCPLPDTDQARALEQVKQFLVKPVSRQDLLNVLRSLGENIDTILVIDDEEDVLRLFEYYLQGNTIHPCRVFTARDGRQALRRLEEIRPDVIFLDLVMPGMDGFALLQVLHTDPRLNSIPVVIVSGQDVPEGNATLQGAICAILPRGMRAHQLIHGVSDLLLALQPAQVGVT